MSGIKNQQPGINLEPLARVVTNALATPTIGDGTEVFVTTNAAAVITLPDVTVYQGKTISVCANAGAAFTGNIVAAAGQALAIAVVIPTDGRTAVFVGINATEWSQHIGA